MPANRTESGLFEPGKSGNPSGRPKIPEALKARARELCPAVLDTWEAILKDEDAKHSDRIKAGENIFDRAWGKAVQMVDAEVHTQKELDLSNVPKDQLDAIVNAIAGALSPNETES